MPNKEHSALLKLLAGLDIEASLRLLKDGVTEIEKKLSSAQFKISAGLDTKEVSQAIEKLQQNLAKTNASINPISTESIKKAKDELFDISEALSVVKQELIKANPAFENAFDGMKLVKITKDADNLKVIIAELVDELGIVHRFKINPKGKDPVLQTITNTLEERIKTYQSAAKNTQAQIDRITVRRGKNLTTGTDLEEQKKLIELQKQQESQIRSLINQFSKIGMIDSERRIELQKMVTLTKEENQLSDETAEMKAAEAISDRSMEKKFAEWKQANKDILSITREIEKVGEGQGARLEENRQVLISSRKELEGYLSASAKWKLKLEDEKDSQSSKIAQQNREKDYKTIEDSLKRLNKLYSERTENARRASDLSLISNKNDAQKEEYNLLIKTNEELTKKIKEEKELSTLALIDRDNEKYYNEQIAKRKEEAEITNEQILQLKRLKKTQREVYETERFGPIAVKGGTSGDGNEPNLSKIFSDGDSSIKKYMASLVGAHSEITKTGVAYTKYGNQLKIITVVEDKFAKKKKELVFAYDQEKDVLRMVNNGLKDNLNRNLSIIGQMSVAAKKIATYGVAARTLYGITTQFKESIAFLKDIDKEFTQIAISQNISLESSRQLIYSYEDFAGRLGKTIKEISTINTELIRQGLTLEESKRRMETILKLSNAGAISAQESMKIITASVNAMQVGHERAADILLRAGQITAASVEELGEAFTKTASSAQATGVEMEQVASIVSTLIEITQEGPRELGTSLKTILARFNRVNEETGEWNEELNDVQKAIESTGVAFLGANGQIRDVYSILEDLAGVWETLDKNQQAYVATQAAGVRQQNRFFAIMNNFNRVQAINNDLLASSGDLNRAQATYMTSLEASQNRYKTALESLSTLIQQKWIKNFYDLAAAVMKISESIGLLGNITVAGGIWALTGAFQDGTTRAQVFGQVLSSIKEKYEDNKEVIDLLTDSEKKESIVKIASLAIERTKIVLDTAENKTLKEKIALLLAEAKARIAATVATLGGIGPTLAITAGIAALGFVIVKLIQSHKEAKEAQEKYNQSLLDTKNRLTDFRKNQQLNIVNAKEAATRLNELNEKVKQYGGLTSLTGQELEEYYELNSKLAGIYPSLSKHTDQYGNTIVELSKDFDAVKQSAIEYKSIMEEIDKKGFGNIVGAAIKEEDVDNYKKIQKELEKLKETNGSVIRASFQGDVTERIIDNTDEIARLEQQLAEIKNGFSSTASGLVEIYVAEAEASESLISNLLKNAEIVEKIATATTEEDYKSILNIIKQLDKQGLDNISNELSKVEDSYRKGTLTAAQYNVEIDKIIANARLRIFALSDQLILEQIALASLEKGTDAYAAQEEKVLALVAALDILKGEIGKTEAQKVTPESAIEAQVQGAFKGFSDFKDMASDLSGAYDKLTKKEKLHNNEVTDLIEKYPELADYLKRTGDITFDNGKVLENLIGKQKDSALSAINAAIAAVVGQRQYQLSIEDTIESVQDLINVQNGMVEAQGRQFGDMYDYQKATAKSGYEDQYNQLIALRDLMINSNSSNWLSSSTKDKTDPKVLEDYFDLLRKVAQAEQELQEIQAKHKLAGTDETPQALKEEIDARNKIKDAMKLLNIAREKDLAGLKATLNTLSGDKWVEAKEKIADLEDAIWGTKNAISSLNQETADSIEEFAEKFSKAYEDAKKELEDETEDRIELIEDSLALIRDMETKAIEEATKEKEEQWKEDEERYKDEFELKKALLEQDKKDLENLKKEDEWKKKLAASSKKLADIEYQISLWSLDNSEEGRSKLTELEQELAEQNAEHQEMLDEEVYENRIKGIELDMEKAETKYEAQQKGIEDARKAQEKADEEALKAIETRYQTEMKRLREIEKLRTSNTQKFEEETQGMLRESLGTLETLNTKLETSISDAWDKITQKIALVTGSINNSKIPEKVTAVSTSQAAIIEQMKLNSRLWGETNDASLKQVIANASLALGTSLGWYRDNGTWYTDANKTQKAPIYHEGGIVGGKGINPKHEEFAKLLKGELVITPKQIDLLSNLINPSSKPAIADTSRQVQYQINIEIDKVIGDFESGEKIADGLVSGLKRKGLLVNFN